jgi:subtilase family serine protease
MIRKISMSLLTIAALVAFVNVAGYAQSQPALTHHVREVTLDGRSPLVGRLPANQSMRIVLALPLRDREGLDNFLKDVSDPNSASFRKFLTVEEFTERFGPSQNDYDTLIQFAKNNGFTVVKTSRNRVNLDVRGSVASIERAFHVNMGVFQHPTEKRTYFSPDREPTADLPMQLWHIGGLDNYARPKAMYHRLDPNKVSAEDVGSNATIGSGPSKSFLGSDMRAAYYVDGNSSATLTGAGQSVGLFEFLGTDLTDLTTYYKNVSQTNNVPITLHSVDTQNTLCKEPSCDDTEQTLDMTQALGMAPGLSSLVMYIGTGGLDGQTLDDPGILNAMATASPLNAQLSCSWAWTPADFTTDDPYFLEFAAQGQNFFTASGDDGNWADAEFVWPADSVYVTAVGGTDLDTSSAAGPWASETGWVDGGGGISPDDFAIPSWQVAAAAGCKKCSQKFRNGPDVSANANFSFYVCADQEACTANLYGGTSFATPMWAGYLALTNEQYLLNGNTSTLGFINPAIYTIGGGSSYDTDFHDITSGGNTFGATVGYDLATGWGSPNGNALLNALAGAPTGSFSLAASPKAVKIAQGAKSIVKITSSITGSFDSAVTISASGLPSGVTVLYKNNPIPAPGSGVAQAQLSVSSTATTGIATITFTGTGGGLTETTTIKIDVTKAAN